MNLKTATEIYRKKDKVFYRDGGKLIKLFDESYPKENILNEALNQARVEGTALHIPRIEAVTTAEGRWAIVMEYIEGETLAGAPFAAAQGQNAGEDFRLRILRVGEIRSARPSGRAAAAL